MPDSEPQGQPQPESITSTLERLVQHPGLNEEQYHPANLPNDPAAAKFYEQHAPRAERPAPEPETAAAPTAEPQPAAPTPQPSRLYAGKYKSVEEMERGVTELNKTLREREAEIRAVRAVRQELEPIVEGFRQARPEPAPPPRVPIQFDKEGTPYIDPTAFEQMIAAKADEVARERVEAVLTPISKLSAASNALRSEYPELGQRENEFAAYIRSNPEISARVSADPEYLETAYLKFERLNRLEPRPPEPVAAQSSAAQTTVNAAKTQSSASSGGIGGGRRVSQIEDSQRRLELLAEQCAKTGDYRPLIKARLEEAVNKDGHLDALGRTDWGR